jgi:hypothetical protein
MGRLRVSGVAALLLLLLLLLPLRLLVPPPLLCSASFRVRRGSCTIGSATMR